MKRLFILSLICCVTMAMAQSGQGRYCCTYQDFCNDKWESLDSISITQHSKRRQLWWGGNDYSLSSKDRATEKLLKKEAFVVMLGDSLYVNCRNLRYQKTAFGRGFTKAKRIGNRSILFVNMLIGKEIQKEQIKASAMFGLIGLISTGSEQMKQQVCYVISNGAREKGLIEVRLVNDDLIRQMLKGQGPLLAEYYLEDDDNLRIHASRVLPILEKAGLFKQENLTE